MDCKVKDDLLIEKIIFTYIFNNMPTVLYGDMIKYVTKESGKTKECVNNIIESLVHDKYIN